VLVSLIPARFRAEHCVISACSKSSPILEVPELEMRGGWHDTQRMQELTHQDDMKRCETHEWNCHWMTLRAFRWRESPLTSWTLLSKGTVKWLMDAKIGQYTKLIGTLSGSDANWCASNVELPEYARAFLHSRVNKYDCVVEYIPAREVCAVYAPGQIHGELILAEEGADGFHAAPALSLVPESHMSWHADP
jgi:hypothetical protein